MKKKKKIIILNIFLINSLTEIQVMDLFFNNLQKIVKIYKN